MATRQKLIDKAKVLGYTGPTTEGNADFWRGIVAVLQMQQPREIAATVKPESKEPPKKTKQTAKRAAKRKQYKIRKQQKKRQAQQQEQKQQAPAVTANYFAINQTQNQKAFNQIVNEKRAEYSGDNKKGKIVRSLYFNNIRSLDDIKTAIESVHKGHKHAYKCQIYMGVVTEKLGAEGGPGIWGNDDKNHTHLFSVDGVATPLTISNDASYRAMTQMISKRRILASALRVIKESQVRIMGIYNIQIKTFATDIPMGCAVKLPEYIQKSRAVNTVNRLKNKLCFWACLALHKGAGNQAYRMPAKALYEEFYGEKPTDSYKGVHIQTDMTDIEEKFNIAVDVYEWDGQFVSLTRRSIVTKPAASKLVLLAYKNHLMYVKDIRQLAKSFRCDTCSMVFSSGFRLNEHVSSCTARVKETFSKWGELYRPNDNVVVQVAKLLNVYTPGMDFSYDYHAVFDYEAILETIDFRDEDAKVHKTATHTPVSVSVNSNVPGHGVRFFCVVDYESTYHMNKAMYDYLLETQQSARERMVKKIEHIFGECLSQIVLWLDDSKQSRLSHNLVNYIDQLPVINFNGAMYDINLNKKHGLLSLMANEEVMMKLDEDKNQGNGIQFAAKNANKYMAIGTRRIKMLDISNYLTPGTSYDQYVKAYGAKMDKGFYPYEWFDSVDKLSETSLPPKEAFYSSLKSANSLGADEKTIDTNYAYICKVWNDEGMKTMRDFLEWYNNLDVIPFIEAIAKQKAFYIEHELDMFKDAVSIPGLAEKIMFREARLQALAKGKPKKYKYSKVSPDLVRSRIAGYKQQDIKTERSYEAGDYLDEATAFKLLDESNYRCHYCYTDIGESKKKDEKYALSFDRIDCSIAHTKTNLLVACTYCNTARGDTDYHIYYYKSEMRRINAVSPQIKLISDKNRDVFQKLKDNVVGGPSIVFHRYHEAGKTHIRKPVYNGHTKEWEVDDGKLVNKIVGYDANALYLWALDNSMPCGEMKNVETYELPEMITDIETGKLFGFAEVDISTPESLYNKFGEFPPIFRNATITEDQLGPYMKQMRKKLDKKLDPKNKKLISSFTGEKILLYTPLLKWYIKHGLVVTKIHSFIKAVENKPFQSFTEKVSDNRRAGDADKSKAIIADAWKLTGNSAFGRTGMDKNRHVNTKYVTDIYKARRKVNNWLFRDLNEIECKDGDTVFECMSGKKSIRQNCPLQVASAVYQLAKLRMLQFYYDCLDKYVDRGDFQYVEMDTDSAYMAITGDSIEDMVKPSMRAQFEQEKYDWFPDNRTKEAAAITKRTPGLFKVEWEGTGMVALTSKMYFCHGAKSKSSAKGIQARNNQSLLTFENYKACLFNKKIIQAKNKGFRVWDGQVFTYEQGKDGLCPVYDKRVLLEDGITTIPLSCTPKTLTVFEASAVDVQPITNEIVRASGYETVVANKIFRPSIEAADNDPHMIAKNILIGRDVMYESADKPSRQFAYFGDYKQLWEWYDKVPADQRHMHEMVDGAEMSRIFIDYDQGIDGWYNNMGQMIVKASVENVLAEALQQAIKEVSDINVDVERSGVIYHNHRPGKISAHILLHDHVCDAETNKLIAERMCVIVKGMKHYILSGANGAIDLQPYSSRSSLRMPGSSKLGRDAYPKPFAKVLLKNYDYQNAIIVKPKTQRIGKKRKTGDDTSTTVCPTDLEDAIRDRREFKAHRFRGMKGDIANFTRLTASKCGICDREHGNDNTMYVVKRGDKWAYGCTRTKAKLVQF